MWEVLQSYWKDEIVYQEDRGTAGLTVVEYLRSGATILFLESRNFLLFFKSLPFEVER